jgi:hypothetical protein
MGVEVLAYMVKVFLALLPGQGDPTGHRQLPQQVQSTEAEVAVLVFLEAAVVEMEQ